MSNQYHIDESEPVPVDIQDYTKVERVHISLGSLNRVRDELKRLRNSIIGEPVNNLEKEQAGNIDTSWMPLAMLLSELPKIIEIHEKECTNLVEEIRMAIHG